MNIITNSIISILQVTKRVFTKCDCYIFYRTPLFKYNDSSYNEYGLYICKDCGKVHNLQKKEDILRPYM